MELITKLSDAKLISPPKWLAAGTVYATITGSMAYGVNLDDSDQDVYGVAIPPKQVIFPHTNGVIAGFGDQGEVFEQWTEHHIKDPSGRMEYDFTISSIVKYFQLCMQNNPNMIDTLFTPDNCVIHRTPISDLIRTNRRMFLHKGAWHKFKGYAFSQMARYTSANENQKVGRVVKYMLDHEIANEDFYLRLMAESTRRTILSDGGEYTSEGNTGMRHLSDKELVDFAGMVKGLTERQIKTVEAGMDTKSMYHIVRLMNEVEQILTTGDLDLQQNREQMKSVRRGEWTVERMKEWFETKEISLEQVYLDSKLPHSPDEDAIRRLLLQCLEQAYGNLDNLINREVDHGKLALMRDIRALLETHGG
jgi:hypothetical protein